MTATSSSGMSERAQMTLVGALVGLAMWALVDLAPDIVTNAHLFVTINAFIAGGAAVLLAMAGPLPLLRALIGAIGLALPAALALGWASLGYGTIDDFMDNGLALMAWATILFIATPFLIVLLHRSADWHSYPALFDCAWSTVVRYAAAWLFVGLFWAVLMLSNALFEIVDITVIEDLLDMDAVPHVLSGAVLGLALRVIYEMRDFLSPFMVLRLLRLLVPVMLVVVGVFAAALPFRSLDGLFGDLSPAATLMAVAIGGISLISVAIDKDQTHAVNLRFMRLATEGLALLLPVLALLAGYAVWMRVSEYGWTPERLAASIAAAVIIIYTVFYAVSVLLRGDWMGRVRSANLIMALIVVAIGFGWLTPLINAERISTKSQIGRYLSGEVGFDDVAVWEMAHAWGQAGQHGLTQLKALEGTEHAALQKQIAIAEKTESRYHYRDRSEQDRPAQEERLLSLVKVLPEGQSLDREMLGRLPRHRIKDWLAACEREQDPGCVVVFGNFDAAGDMTRGIGFEPGRNGRYNAFGIRVKSGKLKLGNYLEDISRQSSLNIGRDDVARIISGDYRIAPSSRKSLWLGDLEIYPDN